MRINHQKLHILLLKSVRQNLALQNTVFIRLNAGAIIEFFVSSATVIQGRRSFESEKIIG